MINFNLRFAKLMMCCVLVLGCSNNEPGPNNNDQNISPIVPIDIKFVYMDGSNIGSNECISDIDDIAIEITTDIQGSGNIVPTQINYTVNGFLFSMTFSSATTLRNPIDLFNGQNIAQLSDTGQTTELRFVAHGDFEEVP